MANKSNDLFLMSALDDEPIFVLLGRDPSAPKRIEDWAAEREHFIQLGERPESDKDLVASARMIAKDMRQWRKANDGKWRK